MQNEEINNFLARIKRHPELFEKFERLLAIAENKTEDIMTADEAEEKLFQEVRQLEQELLQSWAENKQSQVEQKFERRVGMQRRGKKNCGG